MSIPCDEEYYEFDVITKETRVVHICPYEDTYTGYESEMCRVCCGLGVDE